MRTRLKWPLMPVAAGIAMAMAASQPAFAGRGEAPEKSEPAKEDHKPVNKGAIDPATWVYGRAFEAPAATPIWNPAKVKMNNLERTIGGTVSSFNPTNYCNVAGRTGANGSDFTWTEMQHSSLDWNQTWSMWAQPCAFTAITVPGTRIAYSDRREIQKALDGGAMVIVVPTVESVQEARDIVQMAYYPPIGKRKYQPGQYQAIYANVPGGYRQTFNDNVVIWVMIETIVGSNAASEIAKVPGIHGVFGATSDLGNFSGYVNGDADYDKLIRNAYEAALAAGKGRCSALGFQTRPGYSFTCFQN